MTVPFCNPDTTKQINCLEKTADTGDGNMHANLYNCPAPI